MADVFPLQGTAEAGQTGDHQVDSSALPGVAVGREVVLVDVTAPDIALRAVERPLPRREDPPQVKRLVGGVDENPGKIHPPVVECNAGQRLVKIPLAHIQVSGGLGKRAQGVLGGVVRQKTGKEDAIRLGHPAKGKHLL